jgi:AcrR family transcriptional regulator
VGSESESSLRQKILEEALQILADDGSGRVTMRALAERLGYSPATIYLHFRNKDDLLQQIALHGFEKLAQATREGTSRDDVREAVVEGGRRYLDFALANPALYRLMFEEIDIAKYRGDPSPSVPGRALFDLYRDMYVRGASTGAIAHEIDPDIQTLIGWSAVHGFAMLALSGRLPPPRMPDRDVGEIQEAFLHFMASALRP